MKINTIILNSELEFRKYVIENSKDISQIIVFEDKLDHVIFFYCFDQNNSIIATKELQGNYNYYQKIYQKFTNTLEFNIIHNKAKVLKLTK